MSEGEWVKSRAKANDNIVRQCYEHDQGCAVGSWMEQSVRPYMDWCAEKVNKWRRIAEEWGYHTPTWVIQTHAGSFTYHEWLKKEVGL